MSPCRCVPTLVLAVAMAACCRPPLASGLDGPMVELSLAGRRIEGLPLDWNQQKVRVLGRDGRLWQFAPEDAAQYRKTASHFSTYLPSEFRATLLGELGGDYDVSGTGHYMIAHPRGQRDRWAERFEDLYRSFRHWFSVRGFALENPSFPLVGVVCRNRSEFIRHSAETGTAAPAGVLGYYDPQSNRINLYCLESGDTAAGWQKNSAVLIHEAAHQMAFNTGVHSRYCMPPKWLAEGLAMMFEAPGVYDPHGNTRPGDRVNRGRLNDFRRAIAPHHRPELLQQIVASDRLFRVSPAAAYAEAWALSYLLAETQPRQYVQFLKLTAAKSPSADYTAAKRTADFTATFGSDWRLLEAKLLRLMGQLE